MSLCTSRFFIFCFCCHVGTTVSDLHILADFIPITSDSSSHFTCLLPLDFYLMMHVYLFLKHESQVIYNLWQVDISIKKEVIFFLFVLFFRLPTNASCWCCSRFSPWIHSSRLGHSQRMSLLDGVQKSQVKPFNNPHIFLLEFSMAAHEMLVKFWLQFLT